MELAIEVLREPTFPDDEFKSLQDLALASLEYERSEPQAVVNRAFRRHWTQRYAARDIRYTPTLDEQLALVRAATAKDLRNFHTGFFGASNAEVVIVGDFDPAAVEKLIATRLDGWKSPRAYAEVRNVYPEPKIAPTDASFETPDKENAFFMAGLPVKMNDEHPDYPALQFGNYLLGQGMGSRLFGRIRDREGLSYGISSLFMAEPKEGAAIFIVNAIAAPQNTARVDASFRDELSKILRDGYTDAEITAAKQGWAQARQVARAQDQQLAAMLLTHTHNGRTMNWDAELEAKVNALTGAQIREAMARHLVLADMAFMSGGDFAKKSGAKPEETKPAEAEKPAESAIVVATAAVNPTPVRPLQAGSTQYRNKIKIGGQTMAMETTLTIENGADGWILTESAMTPAGTTTDSSVLDSKGLALQSRTVKQGPVNINYHVENGKVVGEMKLPNQTIPINTGLEGALFGDGPGTSTVIATLPLAEGYRTTLRMFSPQMQRVAPADLTVVGSESVEVPAGKFEAYKIAVESEQTSGTVWIAKDGYKAVKSITRMKPNGPEVTSEMLK
jgi:predicted Zn-dependent peptidase